MKADRFAKYAVLAVVWPEKPKCGATGAASAAPSPSESCVTDFDVARAVAPEKLQVQQVQQAAQQTELAAPAALAADPGATGEELQCGKQIQGVNQLGAPAALAAPQKGQPGDDADLILVKSLTFDADDWAYDPPPMVDE